MNVHLNYAMIYHNILKDIHQLIHLLSFQRTFAMPGVKDNPVNGEKINKKNIHVCEFCEKELSTLSNLNQHKRIHLGDKKFKCASAIMYQFVVHP